MPKTVRIKKKPKAITKNKDLNIIILAAGQGTRMKSQVPKVMHTLAGKPILQHVIDTSVQLFPENIFVVCGHQAHVVEEYFSKQKKIYSNLKFLHQKNQLGTAHAVMQTLPELKKIQNYKNKKVLILYADVPLITAKNLQKLISCTQKNQIGLLTAKFENPTGLGRIIRSNKKIVKIIEEKDASAEQKEIKEINTGIYCLSIENLFKKINKIKNHNAQKEYYLTDLIDPKSNIVSFTLADPFEAHGINTREELSLLERYYQKQLVLHLMQSGVKIIDPNRIDIRAELENISIESDVEIDINVILEGCIEIKKGSYIGPHSILKNVNIGEFVEVKAHCVIEDAVIHDHCKVGPFARIRPGTQILEMASVGNFTEIKNSTIGKKSKIPHLSYVGDTDMGKNVNFGAGAITCNYDGVNKYRTEIGDDVFIGSDSQLIAPITIGNGAFVGAGSTITKNAPPEKLTVSRAKQITLDGWVSPKKKKQEK